MPDACDLLVDRLSSLATPGPDGRVTVHADAAIAAREGRIVAAGPREDVLRAVAPADDATVLELPGASAVPGLVDCHTHAVWAGSRVDEFDRRAQGQGYEEIMAAGGGIVATVRATRAADEEELAVLAAGRLARMRRLGTTVVEVKSGYGLDAGSEARMLRAARRAGEAAGVRVATTVLALHATPPEAATPDDQVRHAIEEVLPACAELASAADCFLERGVFSAEQCRPYLLRARELGLDLRLHGDQFAEVGAIPLAVELGARSVDHLEVTGPDGVAALAASRVIGVLLPVAALTLSLPMPPARALLDAGGRVAIATDFNPGSAPCDSLLVNMHLACTRMRMSCAEALAAATVGGAAVLGLVDGTGTLLPGAPADVVLVDDPDWRACCYHLGAEPARVIVGGAA